MTTQETIDLAGRVLSPNYRRLPVAFVEGQGVRLWDAEGREYLDFVAGIAVNVLGHCHPQYVRAIQQQATRLIHVSNLYQIPQQAELGAALVELTGIPQGRAFFCNSGTEASEAALKLARKAARQVRGRDAFEIIVADHGFHGRTMGALSATMVPRYHEGFGPLVPGFVAVPFNDLGAVERAITPKTAAVFMEPVQGEGGINPTSDEYLRGLRRLCDERGVWLVLDEVQTGFGRTGRWFAYQYAGVTPDIVTLAKGMGGGVPIGAIVARDELAQAFQPGSHGSTFAGGPLVCAAALAVVAAMREDNLVEHAAEMGEYLMARLRELRTTHPEITEVRGRGLMVAIELDGPSEPVVAACLARGLLVNNVQPKAVRFVPALIVERDDIDEALRLLDQALTAVGAEAGKTAAGPAAGR
ncbi:MAG TPA: acetylornithine transaminase [bacterium]|nr:acetylornithine transaminase [bacterium]